MTALFLLKILVYISGAFVSNRVSQKVLVTFEPSFAKSMFLVFVTILSWIWIAIVILLALFQSLKNR